MNHSFHPAPGLSNPHVQTIWGRLTRSSHRSPIRRECLLTPDGDDIVLDHLVATPKGPPHYLLLHGLEGSSSSVYAQGLLRLLAARGRGATAMNFRSCARNPENRNQWLPNRGSRLYHSGDTGDLDWVLSSLFERTGQRPLRVLGASVGGNVLLKWLGEHPDDPRVEKAATMSVPFDLGASARHMEQGLGRYYTRIFLATLKAKVQQLAARSPEAARRFDLSRALAARTFYEFDDAASAPIHGFEGAHDYYTRSSSLGYLDRITVPTLCLNAVDDPFIPAVVLDQVRQVIDGSGAPIRLDVTTRGGHVGFLAGSLFRPRFWAEEHLVAWIDAP
ncbi:MAG: alpha/beta fold hydrolase [Candidatus Eisenbacteria bacterium]|nr:alpha/beta fold hydrolase [Candidatus Eisenbacteria bacterium]